MRSTRSRRISVLLVTALLLPGAAAEHAAAATFTRILAGPDQGHPAWSPDGTKIAYDAGASGFSAIAVVSSQGGTPLMLTTRTDENLWPCWSPDGQRIAFARRSGEAGIWTMNATGGDLRRVQEYGEDPSWSPDGTTIAFVGPIGIELMSAAGGMATPLSGASGAQAPCWSPDGSQIAFEIDGTGIFRVSSTGGVAELVSALAGAEEPSWSGSGWIAFHANVAGETEIWAAPASPGGPAVRLVSVAELGSEAYSPAFGPTGELVFDGACCGTLDGLWVAGGLATPVRQTTWGSLKALYRGRD